MIMHDELERLRAEYDTTMNQLRYAQTRYDTLKDTAMDAIEAMEEQKFEIDILYDYLQRLEDKILKIS